MDKLSFILLPDEIKKNHFFNLVSALPFICNFYISNSPDNYHFWGFVLGYELNSVINIILIAAVYIGVLFFAIPFIHISLLIGEGW